MSPSPTSPFDIWLKRVTTATLLAVVVALVALGIAFYGPGAHARTLTQQIRHTADGDVR
jgi:hypothetical protein